VIPNLKFGAAAVAAAPVFLDRDATTLDELDTLVQKAVDASAELIVLGERFIPAFPVWKLIYAPGGTSTDSSAGCLTTLVRFRDHTPESSARSPGATASSCRLASGKSVRSAWAPAGTRTSGSIATVLGSVGPGHESVRKRFAVGFLGRSLPR
jgi:hypothetical protein